MVKCCCMSLQLMQQALLAGISGLVIRLYSGMPQEVTSHNPG